MTRAPFLRILAVALAAAVLASPARADNGGGHGKGGKGAGGHGKSHGKAHDHGGKGGGKGKGDDKVRFADDDRAAIERWYRDDFARSGNCPPGLAKKGNGCLPPGQAKKRWEVGRALPPDLVPLPLPPDLLRRLAPPRPGHQYGWVDGDVLLFSGGFQTGGGRVVVDVVAPF